MSPVIDNGNTIEEPIKEPEEEIVIQDEEPLEPKAPSKPFSWADLASKNTPATRAPAQQGVVVKANHRSPKNQVKYDLLFCKNTNFVNMRLYFDKIACKTC